MQVPQDVDLVPILGAHFWRKFLSRGQPEDRHRVSYVFAYDYRNKGEPAKRRYFLNWSKDGLAPHLSFPACDPLTSTTQTIGLRDTPQSTEIHLRISTFR